MMFCNQCEETVKGIGCTVKGVCGNEDAITAYQDVLVYLCQGFLYEVHSIFVSRG
jgi:hydroxylamine reductase